MRKILNTYQNKRFYSKLVKPNALCFDIGANIGRKSKLMLKVGAKVIAFEPQTVCLKELKKISHKNFQYYPFAVGSKNGKQVLNLANHNEVATFSKPFIAHFETKELIWKGEEEVLVKSLDTLIEEFGLPYFCKIDVEGYEWEILSYLSFTIPLIEFEFTGGFIPDTLKIIAYLDKKDTRFNYNLREKPFFESEKWLLKSEIVAIIKELPRDGLHGNIFIKNG